MTKLIEKLDENRAGIAPLVHDIHATAQRLSVGEPTIRKWIRQGRLPRMSGIRKILVSESALQKFVESAE